MALIYRLQLDKHTLRMAKDGQQLVDMIVRFQTDAEAHEFDADPKLFLQKHGAFMEGMDFSALARKPPGGIKKEVPVVHDDGCQLRWDW